MKLLYPKFFLLIFLLGNITFSQAQSQNDSPILISDNALQFINGFSKTNKTGKKEASTAIKISTNETLVLDLNVRKQEGKMLSLIGSVNQNNNSSYSFIYTNGKLEGHIIQRNKNRAYKLFTSIDSKVYLERTDINSILCIGFIKGEESQNQKTENKSIRSTNKLPPLTLQSRPSATAVVYLDFDGEIITGTDWNSGNIINAVSAGFSHDEIITTWEIMAEDFSPFDVNIVTDRSVFEATPKNRRMMCIFTSTDTAEPDSGGVAFLNSFSRNSDNPCWVYNIRSAKQAGDTGSHEVGHTMGLDHDGKGSTEYYSGHNNWAPIMGFSLQRPIAQWSIGEYNNASNTEDDVQIIAGARNNFGFATDDHGNTANTATALVADAGGNVSGVQNSGIIELRSDIDRFSFLSQNGETSFTVSPHNIHPNLDIQVRLLDVNENEIAVSNPSGLSATLTENLSAGLYYLEIQGTGAGTPDTAYSNYGSLGQFSISGQYAVQTPNNDIQTIAMTPSAGTLVCGSITPSIQIRNGGANTITSFDILYRINQEAQQTQSFTNTIPSGGELIINLSEIQLNTIGDTNIEVIAQINNDDLPNNNTVIQSIFANKSGIAAQVNTFETNDDVLITYDASGSSSIWERGQPTGALLNQAVSGTSVYGTVLNGLHNSDELGYLVTNCYDLSNIASPVLKFNMAYNLEQNFDIVYVEYSLNKGVSWNILGSNTSQPNWYNSDRTNANSGAANDCQNCPGGQWTGTNTQFTEYAYDFTANAATETNLTQANDIMFRFVFQSDFSVNQEGAIIDNLVIEGTQADDDDDDDDTILDVDDNCPLTANANQLDTDTDGIGDVCDDDDDNDGILDINDNCPLTSNPDQMDTDNDGIGDVCEDPNDDDGDSVADVDDNCPSIANTDQEDSDNDGIGNVCDTDIDNDGIDNTIDNCPMTANPDQLDSDNDGIGDICDRDNDNDGVDDINDNCPLEANPDQIDTDNDGIGDVCENPADDIDGDNVDNDIDNCPSTPNTNQLDTDNDGLGDACDTDDDNDTVLDIIDNCSLLANEDQADFDNDGIGDICDTDVDNDGVNNANDNCNTTPLGATVDALGCQVSIDISSFDLTTSVSCNTSSIIIEAAEINDYSVVLTVANGTSISQNFTSTTSFDNLEPGNYTACFAITGDASSEFCLDTIVDMPQEFTVLSTINSINNEVVLSLTGSSEYTITLNDEVLVVTQGEVTLPLTKSNNILKVATGNSCDSVYEETLLLNPEIYVYPNPVEGEEITIQLQGGLETDVQLSLFSMDGTRIEAKVYEIENGQVRLNMSSLAAGIYLLNVATTADYNSYKIIRR